MQLPAFLAGVPKIVLILAFPLLAFLVAVGFTLGMSGDDDDDPQGSAIPTIAVQVQSNQPLPTPQPQPTATAIAIRTDCAAIRGSDYRSTAERDWFQSNCNNAAQGAASNGAAGSAAPRSNTVPSGGTQGGAAGAPPAAGGHVVGVEYALGDQLVIPSISLNAVVTGMDVASDGLMPDPAGYFNAVWYNFASIPGLGGYVNGGNLVMAGHVDCARCHNGASGQAVFYNTRNLQIDAEIQYYSGGQLHRYAVFQVSDYNSSSDWASIVAASTADLTIITCNGTFSAGEYSHRNVVFARKVA
ncbi:MAG: sortase [Dehalococcoidia bacterium]|nr:sortase [Dehalococcoidia bacterium]